MLKKGTLFLAVVLSISVTAGAQDTRRVELGDWPELRGPRRDGISQETGLIDSWEVNGENFLWRAPFGGRSAPIVLGNRVYVQNPSEASSGSMSTTSIKAMFLCTESLGPRRRRIRKPATFTPSAAGRS
jgi:hypothetical protein